MHHYRTLRCVTCTPIQLERIAHASVCMCVMCYAVFLRRFFLPIFIFDSVVFLFLLFSVVHLAVYNLLQLFCEMMNGYYRFVWQTIVHFLFDCFAVTFVKHHGICKRWPKKKHTRKFKIHCDPIEFRFKAEMISSSSNSNH